MVAINNPIEESSEKVSSLSLKERLTGYAKSIPFLREQLKQLEHLESKDQFNEYLQGEIALVECMRRRGILPEDSNAAFQEFIDSGLSDLYRYFCAQDLVHLKEKVDELIRLKKATGRPITGPIKSVGQSSVMKKLAMMAKIGLFIKNLLKNSGSNDYLKGQLAVIQCMKLNGKLPTTNEAAFKAFVEGRYAEMYECFSTRDLEHLSEILNELIQARGAVKEQLGAQRIAG